MFAASAVLRIKFAALNTLPIPGMAGGISLVAIFRARMKSPERFVATARWIGLPLLAVVGIAWIAVIARAFAL